MVKRSVDYRETLIESLKDPAEAIAYLRAALEEDDMPEVFLLALRNVAEARGMQRLAREAHLAAHARRPSFTSIQPPAR